MGAQRNGARLFLDLMAKACKMTRLPGFRLGLNKILGDEVATTFLNLWDPACAFVDALIASDNWFNKRDHADDDGPGEDEAPEG